MKKTISIIILLSFLFTLNACKKDDEVKATLASLSTEDATNITANSATFNGKIISENNSSVIARGFYWSKDSNPDGNDSTMFSGTGVGEMIGVITGLEHSTTYFFRAYATNSIGTEMGEIKSFTTLALTPTVKINVIESSPYHVIIDWQIENAENLTFVSKGVCYSETELPTINSDTLLETGPGDIFLTSIQGLQNNTLYYVRAFLNTGSEVYYSDQRSFLVSGQLPVFNLKGGSQYVSTNTTMHAGEPFTVGAIAHATNGYLTRFLMSNLYNGINEIIVDSTFNAIEFNQDFNLEFSSAYIGESVLTFKIWDEFGYTATESIIITIEQTASPVIKYSDIMVGSWNDALGSFYSTSENLVYTVGEASANPSVQAKVDMIFFKGVSYMNTLAAPNDAAVNSITELRLDEWIIHNPTYFQMTNLTVAEFNAIGSNYTFPELFDYQTNVNYLQMGDVILFKTVEDKLGYILVKDLYSRGDVILMDVIIQE